MLFGGFSFLMRIASTIQFYEEVVMLKLFRRVREDIEAPSVLNQPLVLMLGGKPLLAVERITKGKVPVKLGSWHVGDLWRAGKIWRISLGMETCLVRNGAIFAIGWNGVEEHIGNHCSLESGDVLRFFHVFDFHSPGREDSDITVAFEE